MKGQARSTQTLLALSEQLPARSPGPGNGCRRPLTSAFSQRAHFFHPSFPYLKHIPFCHFPSGRTCPLQAGLGMSGHFPCRCQGPAWPVWPAEPTGAEGCWFTLRQDHEAAGLSRGWGLGWGPSLSLGLQLECGWPMLVLCLMLYLLQEGSPFSSCTFIKTDHILYI